ncbi:tail fiber domain-containing protein [Kosakonia radicincitans]|uniref:tail fiber domain-containing protein n=1 Tax=Kosakonia radicincitans TaxID=283686 RepID=UPI0005C2ECB5|nr:tail fiber domain-containing protein [Kosakonia radicincitans]KIS41293.1 chaperone of endosialidase family protein [Kosakonia radicincitans YD4]
MSAGTITLTSNSAVVSGSGTAFTTDLAAGDFIVATVGGIPYTLPVKTVDSATSLTLVSNFTGPTQAGAGWYAVPRVAMNLVSAAVVVQNTEALRGLNYDKQNWQQLFTGSGAITVKLPDQSTFTGPAWGGITASLNSLSTDVGNKAAKGANSDITSLAGLTTPLSKTQGGTGSNSPFGTAADTFCQGNDSRLNTVAGKTGGQITSSIDLVGDIYARKRASSEPSVGTGISGQYLFSIHNIAGVDRVVSAMNASYVWGNASATLNLNSQLYGSGGNLIQSANYSFSSSGSATAPGQWVNNSDERIKTNINRIEDPLGKMTQFRGVSWDRLDGYAGGLGFIAQEVRNVFPGSVFESGIDRTLTDGTVVENILSVDTTGVAAALHHEAILALMSRIDELEMKLNTLQSGS